jgi:succinate-acetate transporter protein
MLVKEVKNLRSAINPPVPNPAPLGLFAFGLTTALLQVRHTRIGGSSDDDLEGVETIVLGFAMCFGGLLQVIAGISEIRRNNIFGYTAFLLYGGFWMSLGIMDIVQVLSERHYPLEDTTPTPPNPKAVQAMLFLTGVFTFVLWICSCKLNKTLNLLFFCLASTLFLLAGGVRNETVDKVGGWFGMMTSAVAYWLAAAELFNDIHGEGKREIIPLGHFAGNEHGEGHGAFQAPGRTQPAQQRSSFLFTRDMFHLGPSRQHIRRPSDEHVDLDLDLESALSTPVESDFPIPSNE